MNPSFEIALRRPVARFATVAIIVGAIGAVSLAIPFSSEHLPPMFRMLPIASQRALVVAVSVFALALAATFSIVAVRIASMSSYRILLEGPLLQFPLRTGKTKVVLVKDVVSVGSNEAKDHVVILVRDERYVLPWYVLPPGKRPPQVASELADALKPR